VFENRKRVEENILSSHGEASNFFVTFLDNHDQGQRFGFTGPTQLTDQVAVGLGCLFSLQGIPCVYYGTEQGLSGHKDDHHGDDAMVREALWGKPQPFDRKHPLYQALKGLAQVRKDQPELRYGRQYFRPLSGDGRNFGLSPFPGGVMAVSRILNDQEVITVANMSTQEGFTGEIIIDRELNPAGATYEIQLTNQRGRGGAAKPGPVEEKPKGTVAIHEIDGAVTDGGAHTLPVQLQPLEIQILGRKG